MTCRRDPKHTPRSQTGAPHTCTAAAAHDLGADGEGLALRREGPLWEALRGGRVGRGAARRKEGRKENEKKKKRNAGRKGYENNVIKAGHVYGGFVSIKVVK